MLIRNQQQLALPASTSIHHEQRTRGFTIIEIMAVAAVIALLAGILLGLSHYVNLRSNNMRTKSEIAALSIAIEMFRADSGVYPTSSVIRIDTNLFGEIFAQVTNSALLYSQIVSSSSHRQYFKPTSKQWTNTFVWSDCACTYTNNCPCGFTNVTYYIPYLIDPWGRPYNYFNPRSITTAQINRATFDLFSAGADRRFNTSDDIGNWKTLQ